MPDDDLKKRIKRRLDDCNAKIREAESTLQEQRVVKAILEPLLKGSGEPTGRRSTLIPKAKSAGSSWQDKAMEILRVETKRSDLLKQLHSAGFSNVNGNNLGAWINRNKTAGRLSRVGQGVYVRADT